MSGHSKWSTIKRKKGAADAKRGKIFTRCIHEITVAVREGGGGDADANPRLRFAIDRAKASNMPNDTIDRAIRRATGEEKGEEQHEIIYEGYGPAGTAVLVEVLTDNKNRTVSEVRNCFTRCGGALGAAGCVAWMFQRKGVIALRKEGLSEEAAMELALDAGADEVSDDGDVWTITCNPAQFHEVREAISKQVAPESAEIQAVPSNSTEVRGKEAEQMERLIGMLEELDEVLNVFVNCDFVEQ